MNTVRDIARGMIRSANDHHTKGWNEALDAIARRAETDALSYEDMCRLSRSFNEKARLDTPQDYRINEWLKQQIAAAPHS